MMRNRTIRFLATFICVIMAFGALVACGDTTTPAATTAVPGTTTTAGDTDATTAAPTEKSEPVTLTVEVFDRATTGQTPVDNNYWTQWIQKEFGDPNNVTMQFVVCPRTKELDTLNAWMAGGTAPDISLTYNIDAVYNFFSQGGLTDLTASLETYGQNLQTYLGEDTLAYGVFDGQQVTIPAKRVMQARAGAFIRKDWLDILGLPLPETTEEFYAALTAFKTENPGKVDKVVPFSLTNDAAWCFQGFIESYIETTDERELYIYQQVTTPGTKEAARFLNKMYNESLISPEFALDKDGKTLDADVTRGAAGSYQMNYDFAMRAVPGHIDNLVATIPTAELVPFDPYTNKYTDKHTKQLYDPTGIRMIVPTYSKNADTVVKYLDWMASEDVLFFLQYGEEGTGYTMVDGIPKVNAVEGDKMFPSLQNIDYTLIVNGIDLGDQTKTIDANSLSYAGHEDMFATAVDFALRDGYVYPSLPTPVAAAAKYGTTLTEKVKEVYAKAVTCAVTDFDAVWDQQVSEYLSQGGQAVIDERTVAWDAAHK